MKIKTVNIKTLSLFIFSSLFLTLIFIFLVMNPVQFAATWDQVDFALALERFDLNTMQPHFPGYPYFILGGLAVHQFIEDNVIALSYFNILMYLLSMFPMFMLVKKHLKSSMTFLFLCVFYSSLFFISQAILPMSEGTAFALLIWFLWSIDCSFDKPTYSRIVFSLFIFSVLMGVRLSYFPVGIALIILFWKKKFPLPRIILLIFIGLLFQFIWVSALIVNEGGVRSFLNLALSFTNGHFTEWGGSINQDDSFFLRLYKLVAINIIWTGLFGENKVIGFIYSIILLFLILIKRKNLFKIQMNWLILTAFIYFIWALLGQNIEKARHILPIVIIMQMYLLIYIMKFTKQFSYIIMVLLSITQLYIGSTLITQYQAERPATIQLYDYLMSIEEDFVIYTWEETRVFEYKQASFKHIRAFQLKVMEEDILFRLPDKVYITNKVAEGFLSQNENISDRLKKVKSFTSNSLFDPVYSNITLYEYNWYPAD